MRPVRVVFLSAVSLLSLAVILPSPASAKPKSAWQNCNTKDLNTNFGASCNDQMQQDLIGNKPYTHVLFCGGDTMLCCTVDNNTNQVLNCRKPAGSRVMPGLQGANLNTAGVQNRGTEAQAPEANEDAPVPATLTPHVVKELVHKPAAK